MFRPSDFYETYLKSPWWEDKRQEAFKFYGKKCAECKSRKYLHVHHLTYIRLGEELMADLMILCKDCHEKRHPKHSVKRVTAAEKKAKRKAERRLIHEHNQIIKQQRRQRNRPNRKAAVAPTPRRDFGAEVREIIKHERMTNMAIAGHRELDEEWSRMMRGDKQWPLNERPD